MARATLVVPAAVMAFYVWTAASSGTAFQFAGAKTGYYNLLTEGFRNGHLYLKLAPAPELLALRDPYDPVANARYRVNDLSLYRGRYYLYFGPVPVVTLFLPWRAATGQDMSEDLAALIFLVAGYIFSALLLAWLLRTADVRPSAALWSAAALVLGFGEYGAVVARNPNVYGTAVASGYCLFMAGMYCFARLMTHGRANRWFAVAAGVLLGLAPGCRPDYVLAIPVLLAIYLSDRKRWRDVLWIATPVFVCGIVFLWYNFARFGNPFEFGINYQLTSRVSTQGLALHLRNLGPGLKYLLVFPPRLWDQFPFIIARYVVPHAGPSAENIVGMLALSPLSIAGLALPVWIARWKRTPVRPILVGLYACAIVLMIFIALTGWSVGRYLLDFAPALMVVAMFAWLGWAARSSGARRIVLAAIICAGALWSTAVGMALSISFNDVLRDRNPRLYRTLARWSGQSADSIRLPVSRLTMKATVVFPANPAAAREGLLSSGRPGAEDCVLIEYSGGNQARFGLDQAAVGVTFGPPLRIDPGREYRLDAAYSASTQTLSVRLDEARAGDFSVVFYPTSRNEIAPGRGAASMPEVRPFSGVLRMPSAGGIALE